MLACSPWIGDPALLAALDKLVAASVLIRKLSPSDVQRFGRQLRKINEGTPGMPVRALPALATLAPKVEGEARMVGPYTSLDNDVRLPTIRAIGFRSPEGRAVPIAHAKLALLGHLWWHDEGALGHVEDVIGFRPLRLWVSSAYFTKNSRRCLEFGYWTEDPALLEGAKHFLSLLLGASEDLDSPVDHLDPELAEIEFDEQEMREVMAEMSAWGDEDEEGSEFGDARNDER
jgi:hypothetical protein